MLKKLEKKYLKYLIKNEVKNNSDISDYITFLYFRYSFNIAKLKLNIFSGFFSIIFLTLFREIH